MTADDRLGIWLRIGATFFFTLMFVCVKLTAGEVPTGQVVFYRSAVALIPLVLFLWWTGDLPGGLRTRRPLGHVWRCLLGCAAMFTSFASLKYLPIADATVIGYLTPIITVLLARALLREEVTPARWFSVGLGFAGVLVLVLPDLLGIAPDGAYATGVVLGLLTAVLTAGAKVQIRALAQTENAGAIAFYFALTCALAGAVTLVGGWAEATLSQLVLLFGAGITGGIAHILMTLGYKYCDASKLAGLDYLSLVFAVIADAVVFGILPDVVFYLSAAMILGAAFLVILRDRAVKQT